MVSEDGEFFSNRQVIINFAMGNYKDEILCDVVPVKATYILLDRS